MIAEQIRMGRSWLQVRSGQPTDSFCGGGSLAGWQDGGDAAQPTCASSAKGIVSMPKLLEFQVHVVWERG